MQKRIFIHLLIACFLFTGFLPGNSKAQTSFEPANLTIPFIPGERAAKFSVAVGTVSSSNIEVWVFYAKTQSELSNINPGSFGSSKHYGKAVMVRSGAVAECTFVFPHPHHPATPNADLFGNMKNVSGIITDGYPSPVVATGGIVMPGSSPVKIDFNPVVINQDECVFFRVYKRIKSGGSFTDQLSEIKMFRMPDSFNIGIAGDSYGAGEGAPEDEFEPTGNNGDMWSLCKCHRSKKSGILRGVKKFIARFPEFAVDYSFQACSGAVTWDFFNSEQVTNEHAPGTRLYSTDCGGVRNTIQFQQIRKDLITDRKHDEIQMLLMSGGGNNSGFGDVVITYLIGPGNLALFDAAGRLIHADILGEFTAKINGLSSDYEDLDNGINTFFTEVRPIVGITTYPDPTRGLNGRCGRTSLLGPDYPCARYETDFTLSPQAEYEMIHDRFIIPLNNQVRQTSRLGWNIIDVESMAGTHGICNCSEPYVNTIGASYETQGDIYGVVHPNDDGYDEMYKDKVFDFVTSKYDSYRGGYALAVALGLKQAPASCENSRVRFIDTLVLIGRIKDLSPVLSTFKGFTNLKNDLSPLNLQKESIAATELKNAFLSIQSAQYKTAFNTYPLKSSIVKQSLSLKPLPSAPVISPAILQLRKELNAYVQSDDYKKKSAEILKQKPPVKKSAANPLDALFNN